MVRFGIRVRAGTSTAYVKLNCPLMTKLHWRDAGTISKTDFNQEDEKVEVPSKN